jgi:hypothetical protein
MSKDVCLGPKPLHIFTCQLGMEYLDGSLMRVEVNMLAEIDIGETASSEEARQTIVARPLTCAVFHL